MWIPQMIKDSQNRRSAGTGKVTYSGADKVTVSSYEEYDSISRAVPYGIAYVPPKGSKVVLVPLGDAAVCVGVESQDTEDLSAGEVMLYSAGGASILLKNDGTVVINGQKFEKADS